MHVYQTWLYCTPLFLLKKKKKKKKRRDLFIIEPNYRIWKVFRANKKVGLRFYPSVALEGKKIDRWVLEF